MKPVCMWLVGKIKNQSTLDQGVLWLHRMIIIKEKHVNCIVCNSEKLYVFMGGKFHRRNDTQNAR